MRSCGLADFSGFQDIKVCTIPRKRGNGVGVGGVNDDTEGNHDEVHDDG